MTDARPGTVALMDDAALLEYLRAQRWFGASTREATGVATADVVPVGDDLAIALVDVTFGTGTRDLYQLLVRESDGEPLDRTATAEIARRLVQLCNENRLVETAEGGLQGRSIRPVAGTDHAAARALDADQSNSSMVVGDVIIKTYRRLEAGVSPELEMLLFFAEHGFEQVPGLIGWYGYEGPRIDASLGVVQCFVSDVVDGWQLGLEAAARDAGGFLARIHRLGAVIGTMHDVLASDATDPAFAPEEPGPDGTALLVARIDEEIDAVFDEFADREELAPLTGRRDDAHALLAEYASSLAPTRTIRTHGDLHLGQTLWTGDDWLVIDFEGEPARPASARRQKAAPLRDVAGLLRSVAYLVSALDRIGHDAPKGWEEIARERLLDGYRETAPAAVLPTTADGHARQLGLFELEKAFYELRYELDHRPDWITIPIRSVLSLLEQGAP